MGVRIRQIELGLPCLALSSENSLATSSNFAPSFSFNNAASFFEAFSHLDRRQLRESDATGQDRFRHSPRYGGR